MIKTAVIGANGFIGSHLWNAYRKGFPDTVGTCFSRPRTGLVPFDIRTPDLTRLDLQHRGYQAVLIAAANPLVTACERYPAETRSVNVDGMLNFMRQIASAGLQVIFLSSDYVFDGGRGQYADDAATQPHTEYGRQKQTVEQELPRITENHLILRLSKTFGIRKGDGTLLDEIVASWSRGDVVRAADDQIFSPTLVEDVVQATLQVQRLGWRGIVNVCSSESTSRYDVALRLLRALGLERELAGRLEKVRLHDLPNMSQRPLNTSMQPVRLQSLQDVAFTPLTDSIEVVAGNWRNEFPRNEGR